MADPTKPAPQPAAPKASAAPERRRPTVTNTAAVSMTTSAGGGVILWLIECIHAGTIVTPDAGVAMSLAGFLAPIVHTAHDWLIARLEAANARELS